MLAVFWFENRLVAECVNTNIFSEVINTRLSIGEPTNTWMSKKKNKMLAVKGFRKHLKRTPKTKLTKNALKYENQNKNDMQPRLEIIFI